MNTATTSSKLRLQKTIITRFAQASSAGKPGQRAMVTTITETVSSLSTVI